MNGNTVSKTIKIIFICEFYCSYGQIMLDNTAEFSNSRSSMHVMHLDIGGAWISRDSRDSARALCNLASLYVFPPFVIRYIVAAQGSRSRCFVWEYIVPDRRRVPLRALHIRIY